MKHNAFKQRIRLFRIWFIINLILLIGLIILSNFIDYKLVILLLFFIIISFFMNIIFSNVKDRCPYCGESDPGECFCTHCGNKLK